MPSNLIFFFRARPAQLAEKVDIFTSLCVSWHCLLSKPLQMHHFQRAKIWRKKTSRRLLQATVASLWPRWAQRPEKIDIAATADADVVASAACAASVPYTVPVY